MVVEELIAKELLLSLSGCCCCCWLVGVGSFARCYVDFLRERSVIHPLFWGKSIETQESVKQYPMGGPWACVSLPPRLYKGPCIWMLEAPSHECVGTRGAGVAWIDMVDPSG